MKRCHRSHVKSHHKGPVKRKGFQFISPTCYVSYLNNLYICATVNTAIIYLFHGLLSVRYVALYDRIERKWRVFVQKCKRFIGENINKHFPWKVPGRCPGTSFFKNNVPCLYSCRNILFRSVDYFDILFRGVNELSILSDGVNELSIIFDAVNNLNILFHGVNELHITFPGVNELNILFLASMSKIFYFQVSMS